MTSEMSSGGIALLRARPSSLTRSDRVVDIFLSVPSRLVLTCCLPAVARITLPTMAIKILLFSAVLLISAGCSTFDVRYQAALANPAPAGVEGAWEGQWQSQAGHGSDKLRAVVSQTTPGTLHVWFRADYWKILQIDEEVDLHVTETSPVRASGQADLGYFKGGVYQYDAKLAHDRFDATYRSQYDHGEFHLQRAK